MPTDSPSPFDLAYAELRALGITLSRVPGEYRVNFPNGRDETARTVETIDQALEAGRALAAERAGAPPKSGGPRRRRRPLRMTPKAVNRRRRLAHMRKLRARAPRQAPTTRSQDN